MTTTTKHGKSGRGATSLTFLWGLMHDGAEICELVGLYALSQIKKRLNTHSAGLYRDDGLAVLSRASGSRADRARKDLIKIFSDLGLRITVQTNLKSVDFLDVTLNLETETFQPYRKPNDTPLYVHRDSNHPPCVLKQTPSAVEKRISALSSNSDIFQKAVPPYNNALKGSGYEKNLEYCKQSRDGKSKKRKNRSRNITWFNPPYSASVKTNVGGKFLRLLDTHFPKGHTLHQIFNKNTVKVSYSCMKNMDAIANSHNHKLIQQSKPQDADTRPKCNCRQKDQCPLRGNCLESSVVYKATVQHENETKSYYGLAGGTFKERYRNHVKSIKHEKYKNETQLSKHIWNLKKENKKYTLTWNIERKSNRIVRKSGLCNLCLEEKCTIILNKDALNKRSELISKCRHRSRPARKPPNRERDPPRDTDNQPKSQSA